MAYYKKSGRHTLPWRKTHDPYRILVSEIMLQQTQVSRVIPFYRAFLKKFPTVRALAKAPLADVLRAWSGLGYNRRAKFLHDLARVALAKHGGKIPHEYEALRALPGVGEYTAKAVRVFAYDEPDVMLETNIRTALIHEFFPRAKKVDDKKLLPILVNALTHVDSPHIWYAALMDYGTHVKQTRGNATRRSRTYAKQSTFKGSLRQIRGAILHELVTNGATTKSLLVKKVKFPRVSLEKAITALAKEGMVRSKGNFWTV